MKSYHILECERQKEISKELHNFLLSTKQIRRSDLKFWNYLNKKDVFELSKHCNYTMQWFKSLGLKVREASFTVCNEKLITGPHVDAPPVVAKINIPVLNTKDTYNVWFDNEKNEIDRVECVHPIVLRSDILHTVEVTDKVVYPRIQMSFCFYNEPIEYLA